MEQELTMEESFEAIEKLLESLESKEVSLEDSFLLYKAGMEHIKHCNELMDQVEKKVQMINTEGELVEFDEV